MNSVGQERLSMWFGSFLRISCVVLGCSLLTTARAADVKVQLSIEGGKASFHSGEPILLNLTFTSDTPIPNVRANNSSWPFSVDTVVFDSMQGVIPWYDDEVRGHPYGSDGVTIQTLEPGKQVYARLSLTDLYRFDQGGTYRVHVITNRTGKELTTNDVEFSIKPLSETEETALAASLEQQIRDAKDMENASELAHQLDCLPGDAATQAKLSLFLHPKVFDPFGVDVTQGLWLARNRTMVVNALESAWVDPQQNPGIGLLELLVAFKARLEVPYDPTNPTAPLTTKMLEVEYLHQLAHTLPDRTSSSGRSQNGCSVAHKRVTRTAQTLQQPVKRSSSTLAT
jgi:hypothetical protein